MKKLLALIVLFPISSGLSGSEAAPLVVDNTSQSQSPTSTVSSVPSESEETSPVDASATSWVKKASQFTGKTIGKEAREAFFRQACVEFLNELGGSSTSTQRIAAQYLASITAKLVVTLAAAQEQGQCPTLKQAGTDVVSAGLGQGAIDVLSWIGNQGTEFAGRGCKKLGLSEPKFMQQGTPKVCLDAIVASAKTLAQWSVRSLVSGAVGSKLNPTQPAEKPVQTINDAQPAANESDDSKKDQRTGS